MMKGPHPQQREPPDRHARGVIRCELLLEPLLYVRVSQQEPLSASHVLVDSAVCLLLELVLVACDIGNGSSSCNIER